MLALVEQTRPGPFDTRTVELGGFIGVREHGTLIAMAGERLRCPGFTEVSGVCTLAEHRGKGLGGALTRTVTHRIQQRGEEAFLHAAATNTNAIRLYEALGYAVRKELAFVVVRAPA
jgi:predicted GNAT family acetyltransferase